MGGRTDRTLTQAADRRAERRRGALLFAFLQLVFTVCSHGYVDNPDAEVEFQTARAIARRGSTALSADHADASAAERMIVATRFDVMRGTDGKFYSWFGLGHALSMVPFYAVGSAVAALFPESEQTALRTKIEDLGERLGRAEGEEFWAHFMVSLHSPMFGAGICWFLFLILGHLGFRGRVRVAAVLIGACTTQHAPETRQSMVDCEAAFFLLASFERAMAFRFGAGGTSLALAGVLGGFAVLSRPFHLLPLIALGVYVVHHARRSDRTRCVAGFLAAGLPFALWLLWFNQARFGDPFETGYAVGTAHGYWNFPFLAGFLFLAFSPGKGAFLFNPLLWIAPRGLLAGLGSRRSEVLCLASLLLMPWLLSSFTTGWHSSQAWACRYMTIGSVVLVTCGSAWILDRLAGTPWSRALMAVGVLGFLINLGGILTPYRGFYDLGRHAWTTKWPDQAVARGGDPFQRAVLDPRMSPLVGHWTYAWFAATGEIPSGSGERVFATLFGVVPRGADAAALAPRPVHREDSGFRHLWPIGLGWRLASPLPLVLGVLLALLAAGCGWLLHRSLRC